jgi:hypothetical protein
LHNVLANIVISTSDIVATTELSATTFFTNSSSVENCLEIRYTTNAVGAEAAITKELNQ